MMRIAVDAMGGDRAPGPVVEGAVLAANELGVEIALVGQKDLVEQELKRHPSPVSPIHLVAASETIAMHESPSSTLRKKDSSIRVAFELLKRGEVQAVVGGGNSGAFMASGMFILGKLPHVERPAILVVVPSLGKGTVIIDAGANADCKPHHLVQFGMMGSIYADRVLGIDRPRVGVLSNGEEQGKGIELTRVASEQLHSTALNCMGHVEGRDITNGRVDVVVCDGFTGNVTLKTMEGIASLIMSTLKDAFRASYLSRLGFLLSRKSLLQAYARLDYAEYGGAPLLGLNGVAIIAHGGSSPKAIKNAIRVAKETVSHDVNRNVVESLESFATVRGGGENKFSHRVWSQIKSTIETFSEKPITEGEGRETKGGGKV